MDNRIRVLVENGIALKQRSLFVVVGDKGREQVDHSIAIAIGGCEDATC